MIDASVQIGFVWNPSVYPCFILRAGSESSGEEAGEHVRVEGHPHQGTSEDFEEKLEPSPSRCSDRTHDALRTTRYN